RGGWHCRCLSCRNSGEPEVFMFRAMSGKKCMYTNTSMMEQFYRNHRSDKPIWSEGLSAWVVTNQEYVGQILRSQFFNVIEHKENVENNARDFGLDLCELATILDAVPLAHNGQVHSDVRRKAAVRIQERSSKA